MSEDKTEKDFDLYQDVPVLNLSSKESLYLVSLPSDLDIASLKGVKINILRDEDKVIKTRANKDLRMVKEPASDMDNTFRALCRDKNTNQIGLAPEFVGTIKFLDVIPKLPPMSIEEVNALKIDHPYSKMPQFTDLRVHSVPIGSLSTPEEVNKRNKRKASSSTEQTPKKSSKGSSSSVPAATPASEAKSEKKKEKKEKKEKKDKN